MAKRAKIIIGWFTLLLFCCLARGQEANQNADPDKTFAEIKSLVPTIRRVSPDAEKSILGGRYQDRVQGSPSMSEEDIYLFPDHSYFYTLRSDVLKQFITDQGDWQYVNGFIELKANIPDDKAHHNLRFLVLLFDQNGKTYQMLVGLDGDHEHFLEDARHPDPLFVLYKSSYKKTEEFSPATYEEKKKSLLKCCSKWRRMR